MAAPVLGISEDDVVFSAAKLFFAYGLGNALTFPLASARRRVLMAERPTPAAVFDAHQDASPDHLLRRADAVRRAAGRPDAAGARGARHAPLRLCGRGAAGGHRPALDRALRRGDSRRHRLDRDAAHLPVQPAGRGALRHDRQAGARLPAARGGRRREGLPAGRDRRAAGRGPDRCGRVLEQPRAEPGDVPGGLDAHGDKYTHDTRRLLHVWRPLATTC